VNVLQFPNCDHANLGRPGRPHACLTSLVSFLRHEQISAQICDGFSAAIAACAGAAPFDLALAEYRLADGGVQEFMAKLSRKRRILPLVVLGVPLRAEPEVLGAGAVGAIGAGFSPRSVALQRASLERLLAHRRFLHREQDFERVKDFYLGNVQISPERRTLEFRVEPARIAVVPLTRLQIRLLAALQAAPGRILDYEYISHRVWRRAYHGQNGSIREAVSALRERFKKAGTDFDRLVATVRGQGYRNIAQERRRSKKSP